MATGAQSGLRTCDRKRVGAERSAPTGFTGHGERTSGACGITTCACRAWPEFAQHSRTPLSGRMSDADAGTIEAGGNAGGRPRPPAAVPELAACLGGCLGHRLLGGPLRL